jgi:hypothetical protein
MPTYFRLTTLIAASALLAACGDDDTGGNAPGTTAVVSFNLAVRPAEAAASRPAASIEPYTITDESGNILTFDTVELVLREIELKRADRDVVCGEDDSDSDDGDDDCEALEFGPTLFDLPLDGGAAQAFSVEIASGSYDELEFEIHKPEDDGDANDAAFLAAHPEFRDVSIRVTGTYNSTPFTYVTDLGAEQEQDLEPPLVTDGANATELTLFIDINTWFRTATGTLVDPTSANEDGSNESLVEDNIEASIDVFEDDDRDGEDEDDDGEDD